MGTTPDWTVLADVLLQRAALLQRVARDRGPDPLAGLRLDEADLAGLLATLPGLQTGDAAHVEALEEELAVTVDEALADFQACLADGVDGAVDPRAGALPALARHASLDRTETAVLAVLLAIELDPRRQRLVAYLNDDAAERRATPFTLATLFSGVVVDPDAVARAVGPGGGLRRACLLGSVAAEPWASAPVVVCPEVAWWVVGDRSLDRQLTGGAELVEGPDVGATEGGGGRDLVTVAGPDRRRRLQAALTAMRGSAFLVSAVPETTGAWDALVRQASLAGYGVVLELDTELTIEARGRVERATHLAWALVSAHELALTSLPRRDLVDVSDLVADPRATAEEWRATFGADAPHTHRLTAEQLGLVQRAARAVDGDLSRAVRRLAAGPIDRLATRTRPARVMSDIVLDEAHAAQLHEIVDRAQLRETVFDDWGFRSDPSTGVLALFSGPSGTGKTLAAEIIAGELGLDLYKVDISALVSKFIGETEKNLSQVFDAAEAANVVLFFDEADAVIGKRTEVTDSHDRYANMDVAYLLQRMERFDGVVVMATNLPNNIDTAFVRRIHVSVEFPMPEAAERAQIWRKSFPSRAPMGDIDVERLAQQYELSGGSIRNAALTAAFLAARQGTPITTESLVVAVRREFQKQGRLVPEG